MAISKKLIALDERFATCDFLVEATDCERHFLWRDHNEETRWEEDTMGFSFKVGSIGKRPVMVCCFFAKIYGRRVCFYDTVSQVVDHKMIEDFFKKNFDIKYDRTRWVHCNAMNFGHCLQALRP
jgi:hypothetical protein